MSKFPFRNRSGNSSRESMLIHTQIKGQKASAGSGDPGLGWGGKMDLKLLHKYKDGTDTKG